MRDYAINEAQSLQAYGRLNWISRLVRNWRMRKTIRTLLKMDDNALRDIGLAPSELHHLLGLSNRVDLLREAERLQFVASRRFPDRS